MSHIFARACAGDLPEVARGDGVYLFDKSGKRYLDGSGGAAVSCLGHSDPDVLAAMTAQMKAVAFAHTGFFTSAAAEALADKLVAHTPPGLDRVWLVSGGSEAIEAALKLARQYFIEVGQPTRHRVIARRQSYHGNTLGALASGGNMWRRQPFDPLLMPSSHIAPCYAYRDQRPDEDTEAYGQRVADELESEILRLGNEQVMAFIAEPVVGATAGALPAVPGYFRRIREICDRYGVLLILDEVMCGMGRTGTLFASEQEGISPDITVIAKGLGAGYQPIGAMMCQGRIYQAIAEGSGAFQHGHTYMGHPVAAAAALAVVTKLTDGGLVKRSAAMGEVLAERLLAQFGQHPHVGDIRGRGLFMALELVADRDSKAPFDSADKIAGRIKKAAFARGLICYPMAGTIDGQRGDHVLLAPPFIISESEIDELVDKLAMALNDVVPERRA
ncbi:aspartate aminotransferase family protein [Pseudohoeflea coraliihabitans]|uniref:aspartate aminotransferase family protein n=1 Tax=Pseudohoeflea coraliihabitans TaxID=2860393 RepID=UPI003204B6CF